MVQEKIDKSRIEIVSAHDVDQTLLNDYYKIIYPNRINSLPLIWKWVYRSSFLDNKSPIVILYSGRVIAHEGMIPIRIMVNGKLYSASWLVDLAVLPEFRKQGLSSILEKKAMEFSELSLGLRSNKEALGLHKNLGFRQSSESFLHTYLVTPFNHPYFTQRLSKNFRKFLNLIFNPLLWFHYYKFSSAVKNEDFNMITVDSLDNLEKIIYNSQFKELNENIVLPVRDKDFIRWRIIESPDRDQYRLISTASISSIIKFNKRTIDILWISDMSALKSIRKMIAGLALWGMKNGFTYLRLYTTNRIGSKFLQKSLLSYVSHPLYVYYTGNKELSSRLDSCRWNWQMIDSDFEQFLVND